jgi:hypothetical protein
MKRNALILSGLMILGSGCVIKVPGVLDAGDDGDEDTGGHNEDAPSDDSDESETDEGEPEPEPGPHDGDACAAALDILVVVDNSGSMGEFQRHITDSFPLLIDGLDQAGVDWRLAITTTDNGNPWCPAPQTTPEFGNFVLSPCTTRTGDFLFGVDVDLQDYACNDICNLDPQDLEVLPTVTESDPLAKPRPWLQREAGQLNIPASTDVGDAIRCLLPQGVNGCGFEQPLESMRLALARTTDPGQAQAGFLRDEASLLVLLVTDEADCSSKPEFSEIFLDTGPKSFWSNPESPYPTSAVCWNAGVECSGNPSNYDDCVAANKDVFGQPAAPGDEVMFPVARYKNLLAEIEQSKRAKDPGLDVAVLAVVGVGLDGNFHYADVSNSDPEFQYSFGIGPGCTVMGEPLFGYGAALPPVRIREVAEHMTTDPFWSICSESFDDFMLETIERVVGGC